MRKKQTQQSKLEKCYFKRRHKMLKTKTKLCYGSSGLMGTQQQRIEGFYILKFKHKTKKSIKKYKKQNRPRNAKFRTWVCYNVNMFLTKKSKNARMGSGKGKLIRTSFVLAQGKALLEFTYAKALWVYNIKKLF